MRQLCVRLFSLTFLIAASFQYAHADLIVPSGLAGTEGNTNNSFPFGIAAGFSMRYQQVYSSSEFTGPVLISAIAFRPDGIFGGAFLSTLPDVRISISTTSAAVDGLNVFFAANVGADVTTVFNGALSLSSAFTGPAGSPRDFDILIPFTTPFSYNPASGNLLLDVSNFSGGFARVFDAHNATDSMSRMFSSCNIAGGDCNGVSNPAGIRDTFGLVTRFTTSEVPEPSTLVLLAAGLSMLAWVRRRGNV